MLKPILFGFLLPGRRPRQQDPEQGETHEKETEKNEPSSSTNPDSDDSSGSNDNDAERDGPVENELDEAAANASVDENEVKREVDEEGRDKSQDEPEETRTNAEPASKTSIYRKAKLAIHRTLTSDNPEDIVPTYRHLPIFSGALIPFAILLEIPGLTDHWYIRTDNHEIVETRSNSLILGVALGFSIACAVIANICLIVRFLEKHVKHMTWSCAAFLTIHDIINITIVTAFGVSHRSDDGFTYGQAFWMTVCSTIASTLTNITLLVDLIRTPHFATSGSGLTHRQRSLVIIIMLLLCYLAFGALINHVLMDLTFINALYFTVVSIETIGFGDITPQTTGGRAFICVYVVFGILNLGLAVSLTRDTILEALEVGSRLRVQRLRRKRQAARWRHHVVHHWRDAVAWRLRAKDLPLWVPDEEGVHRKRTFLHWLRWPWLQKKWISLTGNYPWLKEEYLDSGMGYIGFDERHRDMHINLDGLTRNEIRAAAMETGVDLDLLLPKGYWVERFGHGSTEDVDVPVAPVRDILGNHASLDTPLTYTVMGKMIRMVGYVALAVDKSLMDPERRKELPSLRSTQTLSTPRFPDKYDDFKEQMEKEERNAFYVRFAYSWMLFVVFWLVGSAIFVATEKWTFGIAMYFCFISFMTIGYGDFSPTTPAGRSVFIVWALLGVGTMTILISILSDGYSNRYKHIICSGVFDHVVKKYRAQVRQASAPEKQPSPPIKPYTVSSTKTEFSPTTTVTPPRGAQADGEGQAKKRRSLSEELEEVGRRTHDKLVEFPHEVLKQAREFHDDIHYFIKPVHSVTPDLDRKLGGSRDLEARGSGATQGVGGDTTTGEGAEEKVEETSRSARLMSRLSGKKSREEKNKYRDEVLRERRTTSKAIPDSLDRLLGDITGVQGLSQRAKEEILADDDARHTLLALSIEQALRRLILSAEDALRALQEQDALVRLHDQELQHEAEMVEEIEDEGRRGEPSTSARTGTSGS